MSEAWPPLGPSLNEHGGDWPTYCAACYQRYSRDFLNSVPSWPLEDKRFAIKRQPLVDGQCHTFWHIITEGSDEENRNPDLDRCARIGWPRLILDDFANAYPAKSSVKICWWVESHGREDRYHIALEDFSYLVVVADRGNYVLLWTAFPIEREVQRRKRRQKFEAYWRKG